MSVYELEIEELSMAERVTVRGTSSTTLARHVRNINMILQEDGADWRVKGNPEDMTIERA